MPEQQKIEFEKLEETFSSKNETVSLQTRLILGIEALDPNKKDLPKIEENLLSDISPETYTLLSFASTKERHQYWEEKGVSEKEAYQQWQKSLVTFVNNPQKKEQKQALSSLKIPGINWEIFSSQDADLIYQRYFADNTTSPIAITTDQGEKLVIPSSVNKFVSDVIFSYTENGSINFEKLKKDLPAIKAFANIFGSNTSEILEAVILAKAKLLDLQKKQQLITQANEEQIINNQTITRINYLNEQEEKLLRWIFETARVEKETIPSERQPSINSAVSEKNHLIHINPEENLRAAQVFCQNLRNRLKNGIESSLNQSEKIFTDPISQIYIKAENKDAVDNAWFDSDSLIKYAQRLNLPFALYLVNGNHFTLLLRGPYKDADGKYRIDTYDPLNNRIVERELPIKEGFPNFKESFMKKLEYDPSRGVYHYKGDGTTLPYYVEEDLIDRVAFLEWLNNSPIFFNDPALQELIAGTYNLSIEEDPELPLELKVGKEQRFQYNGWDCGPLCLYSAILRYAALPGREEEKQRMVETFANHFGVRILTRRELLGK